MVGMPRRLQGLKPKWTLPLIASSSLSLSFFFIFFKAKYIYNMGFFVGDDFIFSVIKTYIFVGDFSRKVMHLACECECDNKIGMSNVIKNDSLNLVWLIETIKPGSWGNGKYALVAFVMLPFNSIFKVAILLVLLCFKAMFNLHVDEVAWVYPLKFFSIYPGCKAIKGPRNRSVTNLLTIVESYLKFTFKREIYLKFTFKREIG